MGAASASWLPTDKSATSSARKRDSRYVQTCRGVIQLDRDDLTHSRRFAGDAISQDDPVVLKSEGELTLPINIRDGSNLLQQGARLCVDEEDRGGCRGGRDGNDGDHVGVEVLEQSGSVP